MPAPTDVPPLGHPPPLVWVGEQTEKFTVPVGTPPCAVPVAVTVSVIDPPRVIEADDGVLIVTDFRAWSTWKTLCFVVPFSRKSNRYWPSGGGGEVTVLPLPLLSTVTVPVCTGGPMNPGRPRCCRRPFDRDQS